MINNVIAYNIAQLEKKKVLSEARNLYKSDFLSLEQWEIIRNEFASNLYTPSIFMKVLLFILSLIGMITIIGPIGLLFHDIFDMADHLGFQIVVFALGVGLVLFTEIIMIREKRHYKSGVIEAGLYVGLGFIAFGILGFESHATIVYPLVGFSLALFATIRYLDLLALVLMIFFLAWMVFQFGIEMGGVVQSLFPFIFMTFFVLLYLLACKLESLFANIIFDTQFVIIKTISLIMFYVAGNYFVVRELSVKLMELDFPEGGDIPFALFFYLFTALVPLIYIYWGIKRKSILWIRASLLTIALSVFTFKFYFSLGMPILSITIAGALLILVALGLFRYLRQMRGGFTRDKLLNDKWGSQNLTAFVVSQTVSGSTSANSSSNETSFSGGSFGGAGAGSNW